MEHVHQLSNWKGLEIALPQQLHSTQHDDIYYVRCVDWALVLYVRHSQELHNRFMDLFPGPPE